MTRQLSLIVLCCVVIASFFVIAFTQGGVISSPNYESVEQIRQIDKSKMPTEIRTAKSVIKYYVDPRGIDAGDIVLIRGKSQDVRDESSKYFSQRYSKYLLSKGIVQTVFAKEILLVEKGGGYYRLRQDLLESFQGNLDSMYGKHAPMIKSLVYGDRSELSDEVMEDFSKTGTIHILALSGFHVGILALLINILLSKISVHHRGMIICAVVGFYAFLTGMRPSILRAVLFFALYYLSFVWHERYNLFAASCMSASVLLVFNPYYVYDLGFVLSFASVMSIALFYPMLSAQLENWKYHRNFFVQSAMVGIAAQILTIPLSIYYFGRLSLVSVLANLLVIPIVSLMMGMSLVSLFVHYVARLLPIFHFMDIGLSGSVKLLQEILLRGNHIFAQLPFSYVEQNLGAKGLAIAYVVVIGLYLFWEIHQIRESRYEPSRNLEILIEEQ